MYQGFRYVCDIVTFETCIIHKLTVLPLHTILYIKRDFIYIYTTVKLCLFVSKCVYNGILKCSNVAPSLNLL
jgi:hypothetical protein